MPCIRERDTIAEAMTSLYSWIINLAEYEQVFALQFSKRSCSQSPKVMARSANLNVYSPHLPPLHKMLRYHFQIRPKECRETEIRRRTSLNLHISPQHASCNCLPQTRAEPTSCRGFMRDIVMQDHVSEAQRAPGAPSPPLLWLICSWLVAEGTAVMTDYSDTRARCLTL